MGPGDRFASLTALGPVFSTSSHRVLAGTIRGRAPDMGLAGFIEPRDVSVTVAGMVGTGAVLEGQTAFPYSVGTLVGRAVGEFRFLDSAGNGAACAAVSIHINAPNTSSTRLEAPD